ncbi:MAG TPA: dihydrofolate reductase family protein [Candidatus Dormibacteraeota bacterium]|nr:dihydrofolate reductase family protein [Candidatus Dormibacteraeota bacterium]
MRRVVLWMSVSVDGFFEGTGRELDWQTVDAELHTHFNEVLAGMSAFLEGRVTYDLMEGFWPAADEDPQSPPPIVEFAGIWRAMPKVVYSRTLAQAGPNATVVREVSVEQVEALKAGPGGDMALGGADVADTFLRLGLVDEIRLYVHPVVLGRGRRLFHDAAAPVPLTLLETRTFTSGVVLVRWAVGRSAAST